MNEIKKVKKQQDIEKDGAWGQEQNRHATASNVYTRECILVMLWMSGTPGGGEHFDTANERRHGSKDREKDKG